MRPVDKVLGADVEFGNMIEVAHGAAAPTDRAARLLLGEIDGVPSSQAGLSPDRSSDGSSGWAHGAYGAESADPDSRRDPQDWGRRFLATTGGAAYIDLSHLELCMPEVRSARDFVRYHHAGLALARAARDATQARLPEGERIVVMANNSDRLGHSWGGHLNVLVTRELFERIFNRLYPELFLVAAFQVSSILYTGQGKAGSENGKAPVAFQLTQRGDFMECLVGEQTTCRRPIVNSRDEAHCGPGHDSGGLARLHVIFHDTTVTHVSNYLKAGVTQLVLALMETGWCDRRLLLEGPLDALTAWGHDPELMAHARLDDGRGITAIEHQRLFLAAVKDFVAREGAACVPEARQIVASWEDTLDRLERRDWGVLARRLDWVLKRDLLMRAIDRNPNVTWDCALIRAADLRFAELGPAGLYEAVAARGGVDSLVSDEEIARAIAAPPEDTRAWSRAMVLRHAGERVHSVTWDEIRLRPARPGAEPVLLRLADPRGHGRAEVLRDRLAPSEASPEATH